jgi:ABC-2 type transport system permease protein/sodium transport system permease protein
MFSWKDQWRLTQKELRETLRDRRTILTLLAMPILLYPLLGLGFRFLALDQITQASPNYQLAVATDREANWLKERLMLGNQLLSEQDPSEENDRQPPGFPMRINVPNDSSAFDVRMIVAEGRVDVGLRVEWQGENARVEIFQNSGNALSKQAADHVERCLNSVGTEQMKLWAATVQNGFQLPILQRRIAVKPSQTTSPVLGLLPLVLLLMTVTGGVYPAIDLTAGERERNTLETLISLPIPKFRLLLAKFVAVVTVTMLTGLVNLLAMSVTLYALQLDNVLLGKQGFTILLIGKLFLALSAFALFYSAVLLLLTSSARSFKEAQAYLIPLLLLSIGPGLIILLPGWNLNRATAILPLVNILLLSRELLEGSATLLPSLVTIVSTVLYGVAALTAAAQIFGTDAVAVGSRGRWADLLARPELPQRVPSTTLVLVGLAALFPAYFIASGVLSRDEARSPELRLVLSGVLTCLLFVGWPSVLLIWRKVSLYHGLAFRRPRPSFLLGAMLLGLATWPWIFEIVVSAKALGAPSFDLSRFAEVEELLDGWKLVPIALILIVMGLTPGVCEECFFRGFFFSGLRQHLSIPMTILVTALAFGMFHIVLAGGAAPERLIPSTMMGLLLGWVRWRSNSVIPGILLHTVHNSVLLAIGRYREAIAGWGLGGLNETHLPFFWLATTGGVFICGALIVHWTRKETSLRPESSSTFSGCN